MEMPDIDELRAAIAETVATAETVKARADAVAPNVLQRDAQMLKRYITVLALNQSTVASQMLTLCDYMRVLVQRPDD